MRKIILAISLLLTLIASGVATGDIPQYERRSIGKITLTMQYMAPGTSFDGKAVLARMKTKEGSLFSQEDFDEDLKTLAREYDRLEPSLEVVDDRLYITLKIWPKPTIRSINFIGNDKIKTSKLQKELGIKPGVIFERQEFNTAFHNVKAYYVKKGYFEAEVGYKVNTDPITNDVDIDINIDEGRSGRIKEIAIEGLTKQEEAAVLELMMTKEYSIFTSWLSEEGTYHEEMIQQDELVIIDYLQNEGYADATIDIQIKEAEKKERIIIEITVKKGEKYSFGEVTFAGNKIFSDEEIGKILRIKKGDTFSPKRLRDLVQAISNFYGSKGYIDAFANFEPMLRPNEAIYDVHFVIEEGQQYRVGMINVIGNNSTDTSVILHETPLIPGELFNIIKLKQTEARLHNIGYFKHVNVYAVKSDSQCGFGQGYRDVIVEVEETSTGNMSAFMGFSTADSIFGGASITERNFNYKGIPYLFTDGYAALRGGGEYAHITATLGKKQQSYVLSWAKPYFMDTPWIVGFDVENSINKIIARSYEIKSIGFTLHSKYPLNQFMRFGWHYRFKNSNVDVPSDVDLRLKRQAENSGLISASGVSLSYDSTNDLIKPSQGLRSRLDAEFAGIGGNSTFFSVGYYNTFYYPISCEGTVKLRGDARFLFPFAGSDLENLPLEERLFLGGETSVRGYKPYSIGPHFDEGDPSGGLSQLLLSAEYNHTIWKRLDAFVFFDAGNVERSELSIGTMRSSLGYGIRLCVFEGGPPLMLGMGYPLNPETQSDVKRFFLSIGAKF